MHPAGIEQLIARLTETASTLSLPAWLTVRGMRADIATAMKALQLPPEDLVTVRQTHYGAVLNQILETFTVYGSQGRDRPWLWEGFKGERYAVYLGEPEGYRWLPRLLPPDERVWLMTEDWDGQKRNGHYWVFEGRVGTIEAVLGKLFAFEYYIVAKNFEWLLCENHHNALIGVGSRMIGRLQAAEGTPIANRDSGAY